MAGMSVDAYGGTVETHKTRIHPGFYCFEITHIK